MAQETYQIAKAALKSVRSSSDSQALDFLSPTTLAACLRATQNINNLQLNALECEVISQTHSIADVESFIAAYMSQMAQKPQNKTWRKAYAFSKFAKPVLDVFKEANFSPECSIALGVVGILLIQPLNTKSEIEERLEVEIKQLGDVLSQVKFSKGNVQKAEIDIEVQGICAAIVDFLVHALHYQKKWGIVKVLSAIITDFTKRFQSFLTKIKAHAAKIEILAQRSYTTVLLDSKETLDRTAQTIQDLQLRIEMQAAAFDLKFARLEESLTQYKLAAGTTPRFLAIQHAQALIAQFYMDVPSIETTTLQIRYEETQLAPRERWEAVISELQAPGWATLTPRPPLWIGGRQNRRGVSWVSGFILDLAEALQMERGVEVLRILCSGSGDAAVFSPLMIFQCAIVQLLDRFPEIVMVPSNFEMLSVQRFAAVDQSPEAAYKILVDLLRMVDIQCQRERAQVFLIIDRIDIVLAKENLQGRQRFLKALVQLTTEYQMLRIIVTSRVPREEMGVREESRSGLVEIWVDTTKPLAMYSRQ